MSVFMIAGALLRVFEGCRLEAYQDGGGVWTIGFGHTAGVKEDDVINFAGAYSYLTQDAAPLFALVEDGSGRIYAQAAYVSFGYNCGLHALELVLAGTAVLEHFVHDRHGNVEPGLVARRALEAALIAG